MPDPALTNLAAPTPVEGGDTLGVGIRGDLDLSTLYFGVTLEAVYDTTVSAPLPYVVRPFHDAQTARGTLNPVEQTLDGGVLRVTRTSVGEQDDALVWEVDDTGTLVSASFQWVQDTVIPMGGYPPLPYFPYPDATGMFVVLIRWPYAVFLWFLDDGVTKSIRVTGPALDGTGLRTTYADVVYDWSVSTVYRIVWSSHPAHTGVWVQAVTALGETALVALASSVLEPMLASVLVLGFAGGTSRAIATLALVQHGATPGDFFDLTRVGLSPIGAWSFFQGTPALTPFPTTLASVGPVTLTDAWVGAPDIPGVFARTDDPVVMSRVEEFSTRWMVEMTVRAADVIHPGSYDTGMGLVLEDGSNRIQLSLLDDFLTHYFGIALVEEPDTLEQADVVAADWAGDLQVRMDSNGTVIRLFVGEETSPVVEIDRIDLPVTSDQQIQLGAFRPGTFTGTLTVTDLLVFPSCSSCLASETPEVVGWDRTTSGATRSLDPLTLTPGGVDAYTQSPTFTSETALALLLRGNISAWQHMGREGVVRLRIGPIAWVHIGLRILGAYLTVHESGARYLYLDTNDSAATLAHVLAQDPAGQARSVPWSGDALALLLVWQPRSGATLTVNGVSVVLPTATVDADGLPDVPPGLPVDAAYGFGNPTEDIGVTIQIHEVYGNIGTAVDLRVTIPEAVHVGEGMACLFLDAEM